MSESTAEWETSRPAGEPRSPGGRSATGSAHGAIEGADDAQPRAFPCERCGADFVFHIGEQSLKCPYCGAVKSIEPVPEEAVAEQDFHAMLARLAALRDGQATDPAGLVEIRCDACGANCQFTGTLTSSECAYCAAPLQRDKVHDSPRRVPADGVLPFLIDHKTAHARLAEWVRSLWFAPTAFTRRGVQGRFNGIYLPYWTFDTLTATHYTGQRGEHYWVTVGSGKNQRRERRTRWYPASGTFQRFFDDVLTVAGTGLPDKRLTDLEPWPLERCLPFRRELLAGFLARTYDVSLEDGFTAARARIDEAIRLEVRRRIGGDTQRIHAIHSRYDAITYKHLLLPVWMLIYRYHNKPHQVVVNAGTGEVQGDRPYSWAKITLAVLAALVTAGVLVLLFSQHGSG